MMKKLLLLMLLLFLSACQSPEAVLTEAEQNVPFQLLMPQELSKEWSLKEVIYEDDLVVAVYKNDQNGTIELIQDPKIQGLNKEVLRDYLKQGEWGEQDIQLSSQDMMVIRNYVGEWTALEEEEWKTQYTFVRQFDLFTEPLDGLPYYQVIGVEVPAEEIIKFVKSLDRLHS
ncbi:hypothetical protein [Alkalicoccus daliensis]|uniref:Lipoprotein n=1 Tax=Alkalicoccus daliensis TaxID=745820 RepID=A0A1H0I6G2_9BACI|nr:hypothetical protein [Alkalicoccus daliensis]SDO27002.1 hypothetical protein SAMN04488053_11019 [Alkalicoccus daliensis]